MPLGQVRYPILHIVSVQIKYITPKNCLKGTSKTLSSDLRVGQIPYYITLRNGYSHKEDISFVYVLLDIALLNNHLG